MKPHRPARPARNVFESFKRDNDFPPVSIWLSVLLYSIYFTFWALLIGLAALAVALLVGCAAPPARIVKTPPSLHCLTVDAFDKPCRPDFKRGGWVCPGVHLAVSADPGCNAAQPGVFNVNTEVK